MRITILLAILWLTAHDALSQIASYEPESIGAYFKDYQQAAANNISLWDRDLRVPLLLVDPATRTVFANQPDLSGWLEMSGDIYTGILPKEVNMANTAVTWGGKRWAMVLLPLPLSRAARLNLLAHESFHCIQPGLGFNLGLPENGHLDLKEGRIYLRLELEALKRAIQAKSHREAQEHIRCAFIFRKYRNSLFPSSEVTENALELLEGIAEFTGLIVSGRDQTEIANHLAAQIDEFYTNPTFVRSFAYFTTPVYGYLLYKVQNSWNKEITVKTDLTSYFMRKFNIALPPNLEKAAEGFAAAYDGAAIVREETDREEKHKSLVASCIKKFVEKPHFELAFEKMDISFDPRNIVSIEDKGDYYPNIEVRDRWGSLSVTGGALISADWSGISVTNPISVEGSKVYGEGWTLDLAPGYVLERDKDNSYLLVKRSDVRD